MSHVVHVVQHEVDHKIKHDKNMMAMAVATKRQEPQTREGRAADRGAGAGAALRQHIGKSAQTAASTRSSPKCRNLWNLLQAKNIRRTSTIVASEQAKLDLVGAAYLAHKAAVAKQIDDWTKTAAR